jgi:hypothetical protein
MSITLENRKRLLALVVSAIAPICLSGTAFADWQGTVWNSTAQQADKEFHVPHRVPTQPEAQNWFGAAAIVFDNYQMSDMGFQKGALLFKDGKLSAIWMKLKEALLCEKLITTLQATYGNPAKDEKTLPPESPDHYVTWYDQKNNNQINVIYRKYPSDLNLDDDCDLKYEPLVVPSPVQLDGRENPRRVKGG